MKVPAEICALNPVSWYATFAWPVQGLRGTVKLDLNDTTISFVSDVNCCVFPTLSTAKPANGIHHCTAQVYYRLQSNGNVFTRPVHTATCPHPMSRCMLGYIPYPGTCWDTLDVWTGGVWMGCVDRGVNEEVCGQRDMCIGKWRWCWQEWGCTVPLLECILIYVKKNTANTRL